MEEFKAENKTSKLLSVVESTKTGISSVGKLTLIGLLILILLFPMSMIKDLIRDRQAYRDSAEREITQKWGGDQLIAGPILTVPYKIMMELEKGKIEIAIGYSHFLPEELKVNGSLIPEIRHRGIYEVALFKTDLDFSGRFSELDFSALGIKPENILWEQAFVTLAVPDVRSITDELTLNWQGKSQNFIPDNHNGSPVNGGLHTPVDLQNNSTYKDGYSFQFRAHLNGSGAMKFLPMGKQTNITLNSPWPTPKFTGAFLPRENSVDEKGFTAKWMTSHLSRSFPQAWKSSDITDKDWNPYTFGVEFLLPVDQYQETTRSAKYAILFILLTFMVFFIFESLDKIQIHPLQYLLVGFALCLFYLLLLALTEHIHFLYAYLVASAGIVIMITTYGLAILSTKKQAIGLGSMLIALYGYLYTLLQMEDFALLMGALGLFIILGSVMYLTRKINWYSAKAIKESVGKI